MESVLQWGASGVFVFLYAYVAATLLWLIFVAPGLYRRQRGLIGRVESLEARLEQAGIGDRAT